MTEIKLGPKDAALLVREGGEWEMFLPEQNEDDPVESSAMTIAMLALALEDDGIMTNIMKLFKKKLEDFKDPEEE